MKRFFRPEPLAFLAIWLFLIIFGRTELFRDPGTLWHTVVGQQILASWQVPTTDIYSFTFQGQPWLAHEWLFEVLMALIYNSLGFDGLLFLTAAALAGLYAWVFHRLRRGGLGLPLASLVLALVIGASAHHFHVRPHVLSLIFLALTFAWLADFEAGRKSLRTLFWLWPLYVIWTNCHGAVLGGLGTLGLTLGGWSLLYLLHQDSPLKNWKDLLALGILLAGCILTTFLNPYGAGLPRTWLEIMQSPVIPQVIQEHVSLFKEPGKNWATLLFALFYLACLVGVFPRRPRVTWLLPVVWLALALARVRNTPLFAVIAALALAEFYPRVRWAKWLSDKGSIIFRPAAGPGRPPLSLQDLFVPAVAVLLTAALSLTSIHRSGQGLARLDPRHWPVELLPELQRRAQAQPPGAAVINDMLFGGFVIFFTPRLRVFVDDRCDLYGDRFLLDYARGDRDLFARWSGLSEVRLALTQPGSDLDRFLREQPGWRLVKQSAAANLYSHNGA